MSDTPETDAILQDTWHSINVPTNPVPAAFASRLERERDAARSAAEQWERECREQCRINGLGASREASLMAAVERLANQRTKLEEDSSRLQWLLDHHRGDFEIRENVTGDLDSYHIEATREAIDRAMSESRS